MPYRPIQWASRSVEGRQVEADGSRLLDFYATQITPPAVGGFTPKVPVMLYSSPGLRRWLNVPARTTAQSVPVQSGVHSLLSLVNPAYGKRLVGLIGQYYFFEIRFGDTYDLPDRYNPFTGSVSSIPAAKIHQFTTERADAVEPGGTRKLATDGRRVIWGSKSEIFVYDLGKDGGADFILAQAPAVADLSTLEDLDEQDWVDVAWVDGYFLLAARSGQFFHSLLDSIEFDQLDFAEAGTNPDEIVGMEILNRRIYLIGRDTVEQWFNAGGADFAFARDNSQTLQIGCGAKDTIAKNTYAIFFLGTDNIVYAMSGARASRISTQSVEYDVSNSEADKARGYTYTEEGHRFYSLVLTFSDGTKKNWTFDYTMALWHERGETGIICVERFDSFNLAGREGMDHIFDMNLDWGSIDDDASGDAAVYREAISPLLFQNLQRFNMSSFQVDIPAREGGQADDTVLIEWSDDNQKTWKGGTNMDGSSRSLSLDDNTRFRVNRMGQSSTGRNIRLSTRARRRVDVLGAYVQTDTLPD